MNKIIKSFVLGLKIIVKNYMLTISIITLIVVIILSVKAINSKKNLTEFKNIEKELEEKIETSIKLEYPDNTNNNLNTGANYIINCLKEPLNEEKMTDELKNKSKELENIMNQSKYNFAFKYKDLNTGFSLSYNSNQPIFAASTIKAPEAIYIYEEAEKGNINLDDTIKYTSNYYSSGTGILKNTSFNVDYNIRTLVGYSIIYSDNAAHIMLNNKYKPQNINNYWSNLGTTSIYKKNNAWGDINANDATIYMTELYNYITGDNTYSSELLEYFEKSWKIISVPDKSIKIASKSGWSNYSLHDVSLILDENPYTLAILTNRGYTDYQEFFNKISTLVYNFHHEYWKEKINLCTN